MAVNWRPTNAPVQTRYDDIWFISPQVGWGLNSAGQIVHTDDAGATWTIQHTADADTWLRCMSFTSATDGWVGSITRRQRLWKTEDGKTWTDMTAVLPPLPSAICGMSSPSYFVDDLHGWVVGGVGGTSYDKLKPVIMFTADGGVTWENKLQNSGIDFPTGEWGWKIQFLTPQIGWVSLENDTAAAILKTTDGGQTWRRIPITDPQRNVELEGIGFLNEQVGWVGGWGHGFMSGNPDGTTSGTLDGGATWFDANGVGRFINRFRFTKTEPIVAYASGGTIYQGVAAEGAALVALAAAPRVVEPPIPKVWDRLDIAAQVPQNAKRLTITVFDPRQTLVKVLTDEKRPRSGACAFSWNFKTDDGVDAGTGHFMYRISIDGRATTGMAVRPARATPDALGAQVVDLIKRFAPRAKRAHDDLVLPDANGKSTPLKSLFDTPLDLMAALIRGGWIIPGEPDRSMFLVAIIGTGPMQGVMAQADIQLLSDWITAGAQIPQAIA